MKFFENIMKGKFLTAVQDQVDLLQWAYRVQAPALTKHYGPYWIWVVLHSKSIFFLQLQYARKQDILPSCPTFLLFRSAVHKRCTSGTYNKRFLIRKVWRNLGNCGHFNSWVTACEGQWCFIRGPYVFRWFTSSVCRPIFVAAVAASTPIVTFRPDRGCRINIKSY